MKRTFYTYIFSTIAWNQSSRVNSFYFQVTVAVIMILFNTTNRTILETCPSITIPTTKTPTSLVCNNVNFGHVHACVNMGERVCVLCFTVCACTHAHFMRVWLCMYTSKCLLQDLKGQGPTFMKFEKQAYFVQVTAKPGINVNKLIYCVTKFINL